MEKLNENEHPAIALFDKLNEIVDWINKQENTENELFGTCAECNTVWNKRTLDGNYGNCINCGTMINI